jgi:hypothetical protein
MRPLTPLEKALLVLSAALVLGGLWLVILPRETFTVIPSNSARGRPSSVEHKFSKAECRLYGGLGVLLGFGLAGLTIYPLKK